MLVNGANGRLRMFRIEPLAAGTSAISAAVSLARKYGYGDRGRSVVTSMAKLKVRWCRSCQRDAYKRSRAERKGAERKECVCGGGGAVGNACMPFRSC